jgi:hypothetical protein
MTKQKFPTVKKSTIRIKAHREWLLSTSMEVFKSRSNIFMGHFVYAAIVDRTLSNIHGFLLLSGEGNFLCAAGVLRQQIDTAMRANSFSLVEDREALAEQIFKGKHFKDIVDSSGTKMRDAYLREKLAERNPWINEVYAETSGAVQLSQKHIFSAIAKVGVAGEMSFEISGLSSRHVEEFTELFAAFEHSVRLTANVLFSDADPDYLTHPFSSLA